MQPPNSPTHRKWTRKWSDTAHPTTNGHHSHQTPKKPLTQQQQTGIRVIGEIVNSTEGTLFTFRYDYKSNNVSII